MLLKLTQLYNKFFAEPTHQLSKLHAELDKRVMQVYPCHSTDDSLENLLQLNGELAEKEARSELVLGPPALEI